MTYHSDIGQKIKMAMLDSQVGSEQLAKLLGVSEQSVYKYRTAKDIRWSTLVKICDALDISVSKLSSY